MMRLIASALVVALCYVSSYGSYVDAFAAARDGSGGVLPTAAAVGAPPPALAAGDTYRPPIINMRYFGGPILWKPIHLYFVWYGTWTAAEKKVVRTAFMSLTPTKKIRQYPNLSNYWSVVTQYYQQLPGEGRKYASSHVSIAGEVDDKYSFGHSFSGKNGPSPIIRNHLGKGRLPNDLEQGVYFVLTSADVKNSDPELDRPCGYHNSECFDTNGDCSNHRNYLVYSFVPLSPGIAGCNVFSSNFLKGPPPNHLVSPNGELDSMIKTMLHELTELAVDPYLQTGLLAWRMNLENSETADLCSWSYVAGDWWYCDAKVSLYPDFPGGTCTSDALHHTALTDGSKTTFNVYGIDGSRFIVQQFWSLSNKGCVLQPEAPCPKGTVVLQQRKGTIQRGLFFNGVGLQHYAPGQTCTWKIVVRGAKRLNLTFDKVALGYDALDFVKVYSGTVLKKTVTGFGKNIKVQVDGNQATILFESYGKRQPYPSSAGFILRYEAGYQ